MTKRIYQRFHKLLQKLKNDREIECRQKDGLRDEHKQTDKWINRQING